MLDRRVTRPKVYPRSGRIGVYLLMFSVCTVNAMCCVSLHRVAQNVSSSSFNIGCWVQMSALISLHITVQFYELKCLELSNLWLICSHNPPSTGKLLFRLLLCNSDSVGC